MNELAAHIGAEVTDPSGLVWTSRSGAPLGEANFRLRVWRPAPVAAGLEGLRIHDLRHTCATLLLASGEHPKVVAERLGHASTVMTLDVYSHVLPTMQEAAADKLDAILFGTAR